MSSVDRVFKLHQNLKAGDSVTIKALMEKFEVAKNTIKRDIEMMRDQLGAPILYNHKTSSYQYDPQAPLFEMPGMWFNASELYALATTQQLLNQVQPGLLQPHLQPLQDRINALIDSDEQGSNTMQQRVRILQKSARLVEPDSFQIVAHTVLARKQLRFAYQANQQSQTNSRQVSPQRIVYYRDNWYLDAWCHLRNQLRTFAIDKIQNSQLQQEPAIDISEQQLDKELSSGYGIFSGSQTQTAHLKFTAQRASWVAREQWHPQQQSHYDQQQNYHLTIPYSDHTELLMDILKYGPDVQVVEPDELKQAVKEKLQQALKGYEK